VRFENIAQSESEILVRSKDKKSAAKAARVRGLI